MIYGLAYPTFAPAAAARIDAFRAAHEPERAQLVRPHVTLVFGLHSVQPDAFLRFARAQIGPLPDLAISFEGAEIVHDPFEAAHKLVLTCGTGGADLSALHRRLYDGPHRDQLDPSIPYRPHMTVATNKDPAAVARLDLRDIGPFPLSGAIRALDIVERRGDRLMPHGRLPFGS